MISTIATYGGFINGDGGGRCHCVPDSRDMFIGAIILREGTSSNEFGNELGSHPKKQLTNPLGFHQTSSP